MHSTSSMSDGLCSEDLKVEIRGTVNSMTSTIGKIEREFGNTVDSIRTSIDDSLTKARQTVDSAKQSVSPTYQTRQHPLAAVGIAAALGFLAVNLIPARPRRGTIELRKEPSEADAIIPPQQSVFSSFGESRLGSSIASELGEFKALALGMALGAVRDLVVDALPKGGQDLTRNLFDRTSERLGAKKMEERIIQRDNGPASEN